MVKNTVLQPTRSRKGGSSVRRGRRFEDEVADLYRLLGAEVIRNVEICQKKVDVFAQFPIQGGPIKHRVIVECKDEKKVINANQRVMQFKGLLDIARETGDADSAEIVTRVSWGDAAKGFALASGISLLTYSEKVAQLIDFRSYMIQLITAFEKGDPSRPGEPALATYYVELSAESTSHGKKHYVPTLSDHIYHRVKAGQTGQHLAIFGEYGSGKSSLCQKIAHDLARACVYESANSRIPILLNLREFIGTIRMEAYIASFLDQECRVANPKFELFKAMNEAGLFLLIFDGLDEMAIKVDSDTLELNLIEIEKLSSPPNSRVLITSRPELFINAEEERRAVAPAGNIIPTRRTEYELLRVMPWNETQIETFLKRRVPSIGEAKKSWIYYRDRIKTIKGLSDLSQRPVLLDMIVKTLPKLLETDIVINIPNLYRTYLVEEIKRQKILKKRTLLFTAENRLSLLRRLAADIYSNSISAIAFPDARKVIESQVSPPAIELESYTREFLTNSFLIRRGDAYYFSHKSILEYLVAAQVIEEINEQKPELMRRIFLDPIVLEFLVEFKPNTEKLFDWIEWTKKPSHAGAKCLGGNCATLLCYLSDDALVGRDLTYTNLSGANLSEADLRGAQLQNAVLSEANLCFARFNQRDLQGVLLDETLVSFYFFSVQGLAALGRSVADWNTHGIQGEKSLISASLKISSLKDIEQIRGYLAHGNSTSVAVYENEYADLTKSCTGLSRSGA